MRIKSAIHPEHFGLGIRAKPVRRRGRVSSSSWDGHFGSQKTKGDAPYESLLERDLHTHINADPEIVEYASQPHQLIYWAPDKAGRAKKRTYTPDVVARTRSGEILVLDAKAKVFAEGERWRRLETHIREAYKLDHGARFIVLTEDEIRAEPRLTNCEIMLRHRPPAADLEGDLVVQDLVYEAVGRPTIGAITLAAGSKGIDENRAFSALMRMALAGTIKFDQSEPLSPSAAIFLEG